jgi:L-fucose mutarotase/ribose pyranase (RbsD/FucU family)
MLKGLNPLLPPDLAFYERSRGAFATVITGEDAPYACFLLIKGVIA